jgi:hypothetical protein
LQRWASSKLRTASSKRKGRLIRLSGQSVDARIDVELRQIDCFLVVATDLHFGKRQRDCYRRRFRIGRILVHGDGGFTVCGCANALRKHRFAASASRLGESRRSMGLAAAIDSAIQVDPAALDRKWMARDVVSA